ncbi:MAG TPA: YgjP-like metallopeptidase domain-containing protein, partial [Burkholderiales bacterium]|nr:YgjP-like metallopeptidase domain-containing protein [Burkholderiales bacterium]
MRGLKERQLLLPLPLRGREFVAPAHALLAGQLVGYVIKRSARRRAISLRIDEEGLRVGAPLAATQRAIENVLRTHAQWIVQKLAEWKQRHTPAPRWADGDNLMLHGDPVTLRLLASAPAVRLMDGSLIAPDSPAAATSVIEWLREEALIYFSNRTAHFCGQLALEVPQVRLSNAKTRWGSCHIEGRI